MFCVKCGKEINENANFCNYCKTAVKQDTPTPELNGNQVENSNHSSEVTEVKKTNKKTIGIIVCCVIAVVLALVLFFVFGMSEDPETVAQKYATASYEMDFDTMSKYHVDDIDEFLVSTKAIFEELLDDPEIFENTIKKYKTDNVDELFKLIMNDGSPYSDEMLKETYGPDYKVTMLVDDSIMLSNDKIELFVDDYNNYLELFINSINHLGGDISLKEHLLDPEEVDEICAVEIVSVIEGNGIYNDDRCDTYCCAKIGGKWKVLDPDFKPLGYMV